jgi:hypothetical protein
VAMTSFDHLQQISFPSPSGRPNMYNPRWPIRLVPNQCNTQHITNLLLLPPPAANARQHTHTKIFRQTRKQTAQQNGDGVSHWRNAPFGLWWSGCKHLLT